MDIRGGRGRKDDAEDVLRLILMFRENWKTASKHFPYSEKELETFAAEASEQLQLLQVADARINQLNYHRAYTLWSRCYKELMLAGRYVLRNAADRDERFPNISSGRRPSSVQTPERPSEPPTA